MMNSKQVFSFLTAYRKRSGYHLAQPGAALAPPPDPAGIQTGASGGQDGFTLVELMIVIAIIGIFSAIATLSFSQMNEKYRIESDTKEIHALLMRARNDAANTNTQRIVTLAANQVQVTNDNNGDSVVNAGEPTVTTPFPRFAIGPVPPAATLQTIFFDRRGIVSFGNQTLQIVHPGNSAPGVDCIVVSATRINVGRMTGGNCVQQ